VVDTISTKTRKPDPELANGARIAPGIPHVPGIGIRPYHARIQGFLRVPARFCFLRMNTGAKARTGKKSAGMMDKKCHDIFYRVTIKKIV